MMTIVLYAVGYVAMIAAFCLWEAFIGTPVEKWDTYAAPPLALAAVLWPIAIPILVVMAFSNFVESSRRRRLEKESQRQRLRIAAEKEEQRLLRQLEREMEEEYNEKQNSDSSKFKC